MSEGGRDIRVNLGLLSEDDLCVMLGVRLQTLQTWRSNKVGPDYVKLGKSVFYRADDVREWAALNVVATRRANISDDAA